MLQLLLFCAVHYSSKCFFLQNVGLIVWQVNYNHKILWWWCLTNRWSALIIASHKCQSLVNKVNTISLVTVQISWQWKQQNNVGSQICYWLSSWKFFLLASHLTPDLNSSMRRFFSSWSSTQYMLGITNSDTTRHSGQDLRITQGISSTLYNNNNNNSNDSFFGKRFALIVNPTKKNQNKNGRKCERLDN